MTGEENVCGGKEGTERALEAEGKNGSAVLGKFRDVNALAEAYGALEAEFTRRSQRLRELEKRAENPASGVAAGTAEKPTAQAEEAGAEKPLPSSEREGPALPSDLSEHLRQERTKEESTRDTDENELYEAARRCEGVRLKIVGDYLSSLKGAEAPLMKGGTGTLAVSPAKPKSISEAGNMALRYFKKGTQA